MRSLYPRAARSFLHREFGLTESLLGSAFSLLPPPDSSATDELSPHRKKWDILRITLETTAHASSAKSGEGSGELPPGLRATVAQTPHAYLKGAYDRSLELFTPSSAARDAAFLPAPIVVTLARGALQLDWPDFARGLVEEWVARRGQVDDPPPVDMEGYEKVLGVLCCEVLPRLDQWDYASEFLQYESELEPERREVGLFFFGFVAYSWWLMICIVTADKNFATRFARGIH